MKKRVFDARLNHIESLLIDLRATNLVALRTSLSSANPWNYLHSYAQLGRFLQCDPKTAARLLDEGLIRHATIGGEISVFIPDILEAAVKHERIGRLVARIRTGTESTTARHSGGSGKEGGQTDLSKAVPPAVTVETELYPGRFIFATIRYQGWRCHACIPYHLWNQPDKVTDFIEQIIRARHEKQPFRIPPGER